MALVTPGFPSLLSSSFAFLHHLKSTSPLPLPSPLPTPAVDCLRRRTTVASIVSITDLDYCAFRKIWINIVRVYYTFGIKMMKDRIQTLLMPFRVGSLPAMIPLVNSESETMKLCLPNDGKMLTTSESAANLVPMVPFLDPEVAHSFLESSTSTNSLIPHDEVQRTHEQQRRVDGGEDGIAGGDDAEHPSTEAQESALQMAVQVFFPFMVAGFGMVGAGLVLDIVKDWDVFRVVKEVLILVPPLLGLKGNLEMTLASRLSTQANLGNMDSTNAQLTLIGGNLVLTQCQATVVGFLASFTAVFLGWFQESRFELSYAILLCTSSIITSAVASFVLGGVMAGVVLLSRRCNVNPDNVATPIAASLGDLTTIAILAGVASLFYNSMDILYWLGPLIIILFLLFIPLWVFIAQRNPFTQEALRKGWVPIICAMVISSIGGFIMEVAFKMFADIAVFQPVVNGVGGNLVAIHASRISTSLHKECESGSLPASHPNICVNPCSIFFGKEVHARGIRVLMLMAIPGHLVFAYTIGYFASIELSIVFIVVYTLVAVVQVALLMYTASLIVYWFWRHRMDPDNSSIPYLTALGDLLGIGLLTLAFLFLHAVGEQNAKSAE